MNVQENTVTEVKENLQPKNTETTAAVEEENPNQINWKKFREAREIDRRQKEDAERISKQKAEEIEALKAALESVVDKRVAPQRNEYEEEETEDQRIQKKVEVVLLERERKLEDDRRKQEQSELPKKLTHTYKDFNQVCSADNLDYLEFHYPEIAAPFKYMPDGFEKWSSVYQTVKRLVPNTDGKKDQRKAEQNFNKPQSMSIAGVTQTGDSAPAVLDEKRRSDNWARMQKVMKGGK